MKPNHDGIGVGATADLILHVSVATRVRVLFENPRDGELMLALERKATLREAENERIVSVKSQPFGGAIRILDLSMIRDLRESPCQNIKECAFTSKYFSQTPARFAVLLSKRAYTNPIAANINC